MSVTKICNENCISTIKETSSASNLIIFAGTPVDVSAFSTVCITWKFKKEKEGEAENIKLWLLQSIDGDTWIGKGYTSTGNTNDVFMCPIYGKYLMLELRFNENEIELTKLPTSIYGGYIFTKLFDGYVPNIDSAHLPIVDRPV